MSVGETGAGKMGVGETGQIIGETGVGEMGVILFILPLSGLLIQVRLYYNSNNKMGIHLPAHKILVQMHLSQR